MRKITNIYEEYKIMPNLQAHQLRVAAVAWQLCDSLNIEIDKNVIVSTCLVHDMGNIIKSNLEYFPEFLEPKGLIYWQKIKDEYIEKYGKNEHEATVKIIKEIGLPNDMVNYSKSLDFSKICKTKEENDICLKIMKYSDLRVGPHGILSYEERMNDVKKRYKDRPELYQDREELIKCGKDIEKQIFTISSINPEDINDESVAEVIEKLKNYEI